MDPNEQRDQVSKYYSQTLKTSSDLRTTASCSKNVIPPAHKRILAQLHPQVTQRFYGCGSAIPSHLDRTCVLDLGCGTGRDVYLASALVGPAGKVIGLDMSEAQLDIAREYQAHHAQLFFNDSTASNVDFRQGIIEDLAAAGIKSSSVDVVISNCVCNLSPEKHKVFSEVFRVLKHGGEFYFSDMYADRRLSAETKANPMLVGEGLGGALYIEDFRRVMASVGFLDVRVVAFEPIKVKDEKLAPLVAGVNYFSVTFRAFKVGLTDDKREDYSQTVTYVPLDDKQPPQFVLDVDNKFAAYKPCAVDANTASIISASRFRDSFEVSEPQHHKGPFNRSSNAPALLPLLDGFRPKWAITTVPKSGSPAGAAAGGCTPTASSCAPAVSSCGPEAQGCGPAVGGCGPAVKGLEQKVSDGGPQTVSDAPKTAKDESVVPKKAGCGPKTSCGC